MANPLVIGRYALYRRIAAGGMATIHLGRLLGPVGFTRTVAIKRMQPGFTEHPEAVSMFLDEARLAARIRHPNVAATLDVVASQDELFLVLEYIQGETLARLTKYARAHGEQIPVAIAVAIAVGALHGLHAAHEAKNERGDALGIVHRDVSPQNIMVGVDGVARLLDFGVAKALGRLHTTRDGLLKGKIAYMAPEQIKNLPISRRTDIYALSVVLWEALTGKRLFDADNDAAILDGVLIARVEPPSRYASLVPHALDEIVLRGLSRNSDERFPTARAMADALQNAIHIAANSIVGDWVAHIAKEPLARQAEWVAEIESGSDVMVPPSTTPILSTKDRAQKDAVSAIGPADATDLATYDVTLASQPSTLTVATPSVPLRRAKRRGLILGALFAALITSILVFFALRGFGARKLETPSPNSKTEIAAVEESAKTLAPQPSASDDLEIVSNQTPPGAPVAPASGVPKPASNRSEPLQRPATKASARPSEAAPPYDPYQHL